MALVTFPTIKAPSTLSFGIRGMAQSFVSEFTGSSQYVRLPGSRWYGAVGWNNLDGEDFEKLKAFMVQLEGPHNTFEYGDVSRDTPKSGLASTVVLECVTGAQHSTQLTFRKDATSSTISGTISAFKAGDYFEITSAKGNELEIVTADATVANSGNSTLNFAPALRGAVTSGQNITHISPRGIMRLTDNEQTNWDVAPPVLGNVGFSFQEAF